MDDELVTEYLQDAVRYMKNKYSRDCTLSEIFTLRRYVIESIDANRGANLFSDSNPHLDAVARLLNDYYGLDWSDIWHRKSIGPYRDKIIIGRYSELVSDGEGGSIAPRLKEYMQIVHERHYLP